MQNLGFTQFKTKDHDLDISYLDLENAKKIYNFHKSIPEYEPTPLVELDDLAKEIGLKKFYVKDESKRFNLNAFKVLGGSYAVAKYIASETGLSEDEITFENITSKETKEKLGDITFTTATDGNHGRSIAWAANRVGQKSKIFMPKGTVEERVLNIRKEGADVDVYDMNYDDCVRAATEYAKENNGVLVQDTAFEGYEEIPRWIMEGYMTFAYESLLKMQEDGNLPTHVFLQAGVGSLASAIVGFFVNALGDDSPKFIIVEPSKVDPYYKTAKANDGNVYSVGGDLDSIMAGLCCGEVSTIGWDIISKYAEYYISADDIYTAYGMRLLGNPYGNDKKVVSGESGAVTSGVVAKIMTDPELIDVRVALGLDESSVVYCVSTEGDTDRERYRDIVWDGAYPFK